MTVGLKKLWNDESGTAAIEYPLLMALLVVSLIAVLFQLSGSLDRMFSIVSAKISPLAEIARPVAPPAPEPEPAQEPNDDD